MAMQAFCYILCIPVLGAVPKVLDMGQLCKAWDTVKTQSTTKVPAKRVLNNSESHGMAEKVSKSPAGASPMDVANIRPVEERGPCQDASVPGGEGTEESRVHRRLSL